FGASGYRFIPKSRPPTNTSTPAGGSIKRHAGMAPVHNGGTVHLMENVTLPENVAPIVFLPFDVPVPKEHRNSVIIRVGDDLEELKWRMT
ncbi:hypothetical protein HK097_009016, partial [Rhizophlyctis rosea]